MSSRSATVLTVISLAALAVAACNPKLAPSRDAPNPTIGGPPLRVDLVQPGDQPEGPPIPPADAPDEVEVAAGGEEPATMPDPEPASPVEVTPVVDAAEPDPLPQEPRLTPVTQVEPQPVRSPASASHCRNAEETLYNCPFQDGRVLSVCMDEQIAYRFGRPGAPELNLERAFSSDSVSYGVDRRRGEGVQTRVRFQNGNYDYVVYSSQTGGRGDARHPGESGVVVQRSGREVARFECPSASQETLIPVALIRDTLQREPSQRRFWGR